MADYRPVYGVIQLRLRDASLPQSTIIIHKLRDIEEIADIFIIYKKIDIDNDILFITKSYKFETITDLEKWVSTKIASLPNIEEVDIIRMFEI